MYGYIYKTTNLLNNLIYIGQKHSSVFLGNSYLGSGKLLRRAVAKDGAENFKVELLEEINSAEEMDSREIYWISYYCSTDHTIGYNISEGGNVNRTMIGENNPFYGKHHSAETVTKIKLANLGRAPWNKGLTKDTDDRVKKYSISNNRGQASKDTVWINNGELTKMVKKAVVHEYLSNGWRMGRLEINSDNYGISIIGTIRINDGEVEKLVSPDDLSDYLAEGWIKGRLPFKSTINFGQHIKKIVICIELNKEFESISSAEEALNICGSSISACCQGKRKTAGGYHWKYGEN